MPTPFATVAEFLGAQTPERCAEVDWLRELVFEAEPGIVEIVKWNSPSYTLNDIDRLTINAAGKGPARLILHFGTQRAEEKDVAPTFSGDPERLLTWHSDIRASVPVPPATELAEKRDALVAVIHAWLLQPSS